MTGLEALLPYVIPVATSVLSWLGVKSAQKKQGQQLDDQQDFSLQMYNTQREDALEDWHRNNTYNHPLQQMQRLREAGLNPHLVYGKGAENTAAAIRASTMQQPGIPPLQESPIQGALEGGQKGIQLMSGLRLNKAQTDNLYSQRALNDAMAASTLQKSARDKFDLEQADRAKDIVFEQLVQNWINTKKQGDNIDADTERKRAETWRIQTLTPMEVSKAAAEISGLEATRQMTKAQTDKLVAETTAVIDGNLRANQVNEQTLELLKMQVDEMRQRMGLKPVTMQELKLKLEQLSTDVALKKFELEFQEEFRKLGTLAKAAYLAAILAKMLNN